MSGRETGRVLKANAVRELGSRIAFDFEDVQQRAEDRVRAARAEAERIVAEARAEVDRIREAARVEGRRTGRGEGLAEAEAEIARRSREATGTRVAGELRTLIPALEEAARLLAGERDNWRRRWEDRGLDLAIAIAERIVRHEIAARPEVVRDLLDEVLRLVSGGERIELHLHPADVERLGPNAAALVASLASCTSAEIVADDGVSPGGCVVESAFGTIDARIESQLERIASELRAAPAEDRP